MKEPKIKYHDFSVFLNPYDPRLMIKKKTKVHV